MSYDLQVWSVREPDWERIAAGLSGWTITEQSLSFQGTAWQIVAGPVSRVEVEDIPEEVFSALPGIQYLTELNLEPIHASTTARKTLLKTAADIAKDSHGVLLDPQQDTISSPRGVKRISPSKPDERISVLRFAWWFNAGPLLEPGGTSQLVAMLEKHLPEALPRRYGSYEPPQYRYETEGREHFLEFLASEKLGAVWYPHTPVLSVALGVYGNFGPQRAGYRSPSLAIDVDTSIWTQPGWNLALRRFWVAMSDFIRPFFGEVRLLGGYLLQRGRIFIDGQTVLHPIRNGWWNGVPGRLGPAVVLGPPYAALWPKFVKRAERMHGLYYLTREDWHSDPGVERLVGRVPRRIAQGAYSDPYKRVARTSYPRDWPFEGPFSEDRP